VTVVTEVPSYTHAMDGAPGSLVRRVAAGDKSAWEPLVERYKSLVWSIVRSYRFNDDDASDVVQTTWLRLVEHLDRIRDPDAVGTWLATTARNECLAHLRRKGRQGVSLEAVPEVPATGPSPGERVLVHERDAELWSALHHISERCRQLLRILASDPPPSYQEVGAALGVPVGSIGPTRARCLQKLRERIAAKAHPDDLLSSP
jgi:RNA polymerase sigma factor (sigma-70 family)